MYRVLREKLKNVTIKNVRDNITVETGRFYEINGR